MTMIDEAVLSESLRQAAEAFDVSERSIDRILAEVRTATPPPRSPGPRTPVPRRARGRLILVAAVVALAVGGITFSVTKSPTHGSASQKSAGISSFGGARVAAPPSTAGPSPSGTKPASPVPPGAIGQSAKVEANGSVDLTVGDGALQSALAKLTDLAAADGGFVSSDQAQFGAGSSSTGTVILRVPQANFGTLVTQVQARRRRDIGDDHGPGCHRAICGSPSTDHGAPGKSPAVSDDHDSSYVDRRHSGRPEPARHAPEPDRAASGSARRPQQRDHLRDPYGFFDRGRAATQGDPDDSTEFRNRQGLARWDQWFRLRFRVAHSDRRTAAFRAPLPGCTGNPREIGVARVPSADALRFSPLRLNVRCSARRSRWEAGT